VGGWGGEGVGGGGGGEGGVGGGGGVGWLGVWVGGGGGGRRQCPTVISLCFMLAQPWHPEQAAMVLNCECSNLQLLYYMKELKNFLPGTDSMSTL